MEYVSYFILVSYVVGCVYKWGVPHSLSQTFFCIKHKWIFSAIMVIGFGLLFVPQMNKLPESWQWSCFLSTGGGVLIGFAPNLRDELEERVHMVGAALLALGSQVSVAVLYPWVLLLWILWIPFAFGSNRVFWAEVVGGACLMIAISFG